MQVEAKQDNKSLEAYLSKRLVNHKFIYLSSKDCDLKSLDQTREMFSRVKPNLVIHLAARVGGLYANMKDKCGFYEDNIMINMNVVKCCHEFSVTTLLSALSTCVFPDYPSSEKEFHLLEEKDIHMGPPHPSNEGYAYAKRMLEMQSRLYKEQYGRDFRCMIPTNLYGKYDVYGETSHVVAGLIEKAYNAK